MSRLNTTVSIVIRTIDHRLEVLERALFSLYCNDYPDKEVIIVYQGKDPDTLEEIRSLTAYYPELHTKLLQNKTVKDERAKNINLGIQAAMGRYLCFLDDDDIYFPEHLSVLVKALETHETAWAYSQVSRNIEKDGYTYKIDYPFWKPGFSFIDLLTDNYIPIHSFMVDLSKIQDKENVRFDETFNKHEDYSFLLKLASQYKPSVHFGVTCAYNIRGDGSNTIMDGAVRALFDIEPNPQLEKEWKRATQKLNQIKAEILSQYYWIAEVLPPNSPLRNLLD